MEPINKPLSVFCDDDYFLGIPTFATTPRVSNEDDITRAFVASLDQEMDFAEVWGTCAQNTDPHDSESSECSSNSQFDVETPPSTTTKSTARPKTHRRTTQKHRIDEVRKEAEELTARLKELRAQWLPLENNTHRKSLWQQIAFRQLERRRKAEEENLQLREMVQLQTFEARSLRRIVKRRSKIKMMEDMLGITKDAGIHRIIPDRTGQAISLIDRSVDQAYASIDTVLDEKGISALPCPGRSCQKRRTLVNGVFLELSQRTAVPFARSDTEKAVWAALERMAGQQMNFSKEIDCKFHDTERIVSDQGDKMTRRFFVTCRQASNVAGALVQMVIRMFVENDRTVFICNSLLETKLANTSKSSGYQTRTTLIAVVRQQRMVFGDMSMIDWHFSATREDHGFPEARAIRSPVVLSIGADVWDHIISSLPDAVENSLVDNFASVSLN